MHFKLSCEPSNLNLNGHRILTKLCGVVKKMVIEMMSKMLKWEGKFNRTKVFSLLLKSMLLQEGLL